MAPGNEPEKSSSRWWRALRRILPWTSLLLGVSGALGMDRRPERAWLVAAAAAGGWLVLAAFAVLDGLEPRRLSRNQALAARAAQFSTVFGTQSLMQLCLFFSLPFFARASAVPAHYAFVAVIAAAGGVTLWTPLYRAALKVPVSAAALQAIASFAGLDCVLPVLGASNRVSLIVAALSTAAGLPLAVRATAPAGEKRRVRTAAGLLVSVGLAAALLFGGARVVPPAPLRFVEGAIGTQVVERRLIDPATTLAAAPAQLVCATAIAAPRGLKDRLRHVWRQNGVVRAEIPLEIRGGRPQGFRTWSYRRSPGPGHWTCTVETESGQLLGRASIRIGEPPP